MAQVTDTEVALVRRFNRRWTQLIGVLDEGLVDTELSLTEARVLYELAHRSGPTAGEICRELELDAGYVSRMVRRFSKEGYLTSARSSADARRAHLHLSAKGRRLFRRLNDKQNEAVRALLAQRSPDARRTVLASLVTAEHALASATSPRPTAFTVRTHRVGDLGWVVWRHGVLYAQEFGWNERFEGLVAQVVAEFVDHFDPKCERCWIAEREGAPIGSVFLVKKSPSVAKLRLLLVEPSARGLGVGHRLVDECIGFAKRAGYRRITLWTNNVLHSARRIYEAAGFLLTEEEPHKRFGPPLVGQTWELSLQ